MLFHQLLQNVTVNVEAWQADHVDLLQVVIIERSDYQLEGQHLIRVIQDRPSKRVHPLCVASARTVLAQSDQEPRQGGATFLRGEIFLLGRRSVNIVFDLFEFIFIGKIFLQDALVDLL